MLPPVLNQHASLSTILDMQADMSGHKRYTICVTLGPVFEQLGPRKPNMPISRVDYGACKLHGILAPLSPEWHPSKPPITSFRASSHSDTMVQAQIGSMQTSVVRLRQCKSCATSRMRAIKARRAFSVSNAASTSAKQAVQDDQVELGKTGLPHYRTQFTSSGRLSSVRGLPHSLT